MKIVKERKLRKIEDEEWRDIEGAVGRYKISSYGRLKSYAFDKINGRLLRNSQVKNFHTVKLKIGEKEKTYLVHKLVAAAWLKQESPECTRVIHLDFNTKNNHYSNLQWVTHEFTIQHTILLNN